MGSLGAFLLVLGVLIANMPAVAQQWREDRAGAIKTIWLALTYLVYCFIGIAITLWLAMTEVPGGGRPNAWPAIGFILSWIFYGGLTLMRVVPRYREPSRWLMRFGALDIVLLALVVGCFAAAVAQL